MAKIFCRATVHEFDCGILRNSEQCALILNNVRNSEQFGEFAIYSAFKISGQFFLAQNLADMLGIIIVLGGY
jgi:hypothetical protein